VQLQHLQTQLRPALRHYAVHPRSVNQTNAPMLPIMLATKLLPEQEAEREQLLLGVEGGREALPAVEEGDAALRVAVAGLAEGEGVLNPKGQRRTQLAAAVRAAVDAPPVEVEHLGAGAPALEGGAALLAAASYGAGLAPG
jgi:hypothetical protein